MNILIVIVLSLTVIFLVCLMGILLFASYLFFRGSLGKRIMQDLKKDVSHVTKQVEDGDVISLTSDLDKALDYFPESVRYESQNVQGE